MALSPIGVKAPNFTDDIERHKEWQRGDLGNPPPAV